MRIARRLGLCTTVVAAFLAFTMLAASADDGAGQGQTPKSASLGFVAMDDLTGELNYNADPLGEDAGFSAHCSDYDSFALTQRFPPAGPTASVKVSATCTDQDGVTVYLLASLTDKGEPGTRDTVCILWNYGSPPSREHEEDAFIHDHGKILAGNIVVHVDELYVEMLGPQ